MTDDQDLHDLLHRATDDLSPDIATIVRSGTSRGRARRRRNLVGTSFVAVLAVGGVAAGAALLGGGVGPQANDDGSFAGSSKSAISASVATHDDQHRVLAQDRIDLALATMLGPDGSDDGSVTSTGSGVAVAGSAGGDDSGITTSTTEGWHDGTVTIEIGDPQPATAVAVGEDPPAPTPYPGPEQACRAASADDTGVTQSCHEVDNGDWAYSTTGRPDVSVTAVSPGDPGLVTGGGDDSQSTPPSGTVTPVEASPEVTTATSVTLFTTDAWRVAATATAPNGSKDPVLGTDDLQLMTQDGSWFDPHGTVEPTDGPGVGPGSSTTTGPGSVTSGAVVPSDRTARPVEDLPGIFSDLVPGTITHIHATSDAADHPVTTFDWDGYAVKVSLKRVTLPAGGGGQSTSSGGGAGSSSPNTLAASTTTPDGWQVDISVTGLDPKAKMTAEQVSDAAQSDSWFS